MDWNCPVCGTSGVFFSGMDKSLVGAGIGIDHQIQTPGCLGRVLIVEQFLFAGPGSLESPEQISKIRAAAHCTDTDEKAVEVWRLFSFECYGAVFMQARPDTIIAFLEWLERRKESAV
jgi:hypothetical protein